MENIKLPFRDKPGHHHRSIGNLHILLRVIGRPLIIVISKDLMLTIGMNAPPLLDLVTFNCLATTLIGNSPADSYWRLILPIYILPILSTCPKTVSTHAPQFSSMKSLMLRNFLL